MAILAGYGQVEITPPLGVELGGYGCYLKRRAETVHDALYARCLYVEVDGAPHYLLSCDLPGLTDGVWAALASAVSPTALMSVCTHTHTGPATLKTIGCGEQDPAYLGALPGLLLRALAAAKADCMPVTGLRRGRAATGEPVGYNRAGLDNLDTTARGFTLLRRGGAPVTLVSYNCHPVTVGRLAAVSADYPGRVVAEIEATGAHGIFVGGPCGDIDPASNQKGWGSGTWDTVAHYGRLVAGAFRRAEATAATEPPAPVAGGRFAATLPLRAVSPAEADAVVARVEARSGAGFARVARIWRDEIAALQTPGFVYREKAEISWLRLGNVLLVAVPYEIFTQIGQEIEAAFPQLLVLVLGNADAQWGYLPMGSADKIRDYESIDSALVYNRLPFAPGAAEALVAQVAEGLKRDAGV